MKRFSFIIIVAVLLVSFLAPVAADAINLKLNVTYPRLPVPGGSFDLNKMVEKQNVSGEQVITLGIIIIFLFVFSIWVSGFILLISLIYTGILYITSGDNPAKRAKASERLTSVLWGIGILLFAYIIVFIISPDIVRLRATGPDSVAPGSSQEAPQREEAPPGTQDEQKYCSSADTLRSSDEHASVAKDACEKEYKELLTDGFDDRDQTAGYIVNYLNIEDDECGDGDVSAVQTKLQDGSVPECS